MPGFYHILHVLLTLCHQMVSTLNNSAEVSCEKQRENKLMMTAYVPHSCSPVPELSFLPAPYRD